MNKEKKKIKCPRCGNTQLYLCSMGAWNCPDCFNFVRMATKEERNKQLKEIKSNKANKFWRDNFQPSELEEHILLARGKRY
uniref:Uncharacterized protein n=1 Tax=viral metagenome TaxID=1070528 RepID=A0A6M3XA52_9ZZZZ